MGVTGLWKLLESSGNPVPVETLEGKILAIDISIWLHQVVKGYQDNMGSSIPNAHLLGLFHRLCKLLYYKVRPIFVFDGCVPQLKRETIARRQLQRSKLNNEVGRMHALFFQSMAKEQIVKQALGKNTQHLINPLNKKQALNIEKYDSCEKADIFIENSTDNSAAFYFENNPAPILDLSVSTEDSTYENPTFMREYKANLQDIDISSDYFKSLPPELRYEILLDMKETRKQSSWGHLHELPSRSDDFSSFQMNQLLKRRAVQESIEESEKQIGEKAMTYTELKKYFTENGLVDSDYVNKSAKHMGCDEAMRHSLIRDLTKMGNREVKQTAENIKESKTYTKIYESHILKTSEELNNEYDTDSNKGTQFSINDTSGNNSCIESEAQFWLKRSQALVKQLKNDTIDRLGTEDVHVDAM